MGNPTMCQKGYWLLSMPVILLVISNSRVRFFTVVITTHERGSLALVISTLEQATLTLAITTHARGSVTLILLPICMRCV